MSLFSTPEEHAAHPPQSWEVRKRAERLWGLFASATDEQPLQSFTTRREAEEHKVGGYWVNEYAREGRWMAGENQPPRKPYAQVVAEREANDRAQALFRAFRQAGYKPVYLDEPKRCCGGREELAADRPVWGDADGWLWCRMHLDALLRETASA